MERYRCKRCGYQGKQMCDIKTHYRKKTPCYAKYCDETYEQLLERLERGEHDQPINTLIRHIKNDEGSVKNQLRNMYTLGMLNTMHVSLHIGDLVVDEDNTVKTIIDIITYESKQGTHQFLQEISRLLKRQAELNSHKTETVARIVILEDDKKVILLCTDGSVVNP